MTAKEYLRQALTAEREVNEKMMELEKLRAVAANLSAPGVDGMPKGSRKEKLSDTVIRIVALEEHINERIDRLINIKNIITRQIDGLGSARSRLVLSCRYLRMMKWEEISEELKYERSTLLKMHRKALKEFEQAYPQIRKIRI